MGISWAYTGTIGKMPSKRAKKKRKRKQPSPVLSKTPILDKVIQYAANKRATYPKLSRSLRALEQFVGADELKESLAKTLQYLIMVRTPKQKRRSKRMRSNSEDHADNATQEEDEEEEEEEDQEEDSEWSSEDDVEIEQSEAAKIMLKCLLNSLMRNKADDSDSEAAVMMHQPTTRNATLPKLHTMLLGPPGTGKTSFAHILAKIWQALRIVENDTFLVTRRSDWVGKYQGHSCARARKLIARAQGGVIFIDEAYSLIMDKKGDDMYGNEVIAEICEAMYNPEKNVTFIMAGYENDMKRLFDANAGLKRRFDFIYTFKKPNPEQLMQIFTQQVRGSNWRMKRGQRQDLIDFFTKNMGKLHHAGGSTEQLVRQAQQAVVARTFPVRAPHVITVDDVWEGMKTLEKINGKTTVPSFIQHRYL